MKNISKESSKISLIENNPKEDGTYLSYSRNDKTIDRKKSNWTPSPLEGEFLFILIIHIPTPPTDTTHPYYITLHYITGRKEDASNMRVDGLPKKLDENFPIQSFPQYGYSISLIFGFARISNIKHKTQHP